MRWGESPFREIRQGATRRAKQNQKAAHLPAVLNHLRRLLLGQLRFPSSSSNNPDSSSSSRISPFGGGTCSSSDEQLSQLLVVGSACGSYSFLKTSKIPFTVGLARREYERGEDGNNTFRAQARCTIPQ